MRDIAQNTVIQLDITNACHLSCQGCTRHVGHHRAPYFMGIETVRAAIDSLDGWGGRIGIMGGEPSLHPRFTEILGLYAARVPIERREFWTAGFRWGENAALIKETFLPDRVHYNDHIAYDGMHKPLLVAIEDAIDDPELRRRLIENCSYQSHWSAAITPKGAYACEIAASLDWLFDLGIAWPVLPGWWKRTVADYGPMIEHACSKCSGAIPMPSRSDGRGGRDGPAYDVVSPGNLARLKAAGSRKIQAGHYELFDRKITREEIEAHGHLNPRAFRGFVAHKPEDVPV